MGATDDRSPDQTADMTSTLVERLRDGDPTAASLLDRLYRDALVRFCWGYLGTMEAAEDALQDIWFKVLASETVPQRFRAWLYRIARNHCLTVLRNQSRRKEGAVGSMAAQLVDSMTGQLTRLVKDERHAQLVKLVQSLPDTQQEVLRLRYVENLSRSEIAEVVGAPESVVKSRIFEGLSKLREHSSLLGEV